MENSKEANLNFYTCQSRQGNKIKSVKRNLLIFYDVKSVVKSKLYGTKIL